MAARFWVLGTGTWDAVTTTNWSATSGGAGGASVPTSADDVTFDSNSGAAATVTIATVGANANTVTINKSDLTLTHVAVGSTVVGAVTLTAGTLNTNGQTCSWGTFASNNSNTRTLTLGASAITLTGTSTTALSISPSTGLTMTANTATITSTGSSTVITLAAGFNFNGTSLVFSGAGSITWNADGTVANFTRTGTATKLDALQMNGPMTCTGTFTATGNSAINRVFVTSNAVGTSRTITAAVVSLTNVDFTDITGAGAATWTGTSMGNALGNSNITFDTPVTQTHTSSAGGNWSDVTKWTSRVPLPQDNVVIDVNTTGTLTADMPRLGADITMTGFLGTFSNSIAVTQYGSLTLGTGQTFTTTAASYNLNGRSSHTLTMSGKSFGNSLVITAPGGTYAMQDAFLSVGQVTLAFGTLTTGGFSMTMANFISTGTSTRAITLGSSTVTLTSTATLSTWSVASTGLTLSAASSIIVFSSASTNTRTFAGAGLTYGTLTYTVATSPGSLTITGANTFANITATGGRIITMPAATTTTVTNFNVNGAVNGYLYEPGVASNYASAPDSVPLSITGALTIDAKIAADSWTPASSLSIVAKWNAAGASSYLWRLAAAGQFVFTASQDGTASTLNSTGTTATGLSAGALKWCRVTFTPNSATGLKFWLSDDGTTWTQLGTSQSTVAIASVFDSTALLEIGSQNTGSAGLPAKYYNVKVYASDLDSGAGTPIFNSDFTTKPVGANTFTESSSNAATVTINGTLAQAGDGRVSLVSSSGGSAATMTSTNQQSVNYLSIQDSTVNASPKWYAGSKSTNVSGNTNWLFVDPPAAGGGGEGGTGVLSLTNLLNLRSL